MSFFFVRSLFVAYNETVTSLSCKILPTKFRQVKHPSSLWRNAIK